MTSGFWQTSRIPRVALILLAAGFLVYRAVPDLTSNFGRGSVGHEIPALALKTIDGAPVTRETLRGRVVLVNFWASWCGPCVTEMPAFQRIFLEKNAAGFTVLGVWTNDTDAFAMRDLLRTSHITYPIVVATDDVVRDFGGVWGIPTSVLVDRTGRIHRRITGMFAEDALRAAVDSLLAEPPTTAQR